MEPVEPTEGMERAEPGYRRALSSIRDYIHWGPVWAGVIGFFATLFLLSLLGLGIGLATVDPATNAAGIGTPAFIWGGIALLLSYFVGGWFAGWTSSYRGSTMSAFILGTTVWALSVVLIVVVSATGLIGTLASILGVLNLTAIGIGPIGADVAATAASTALWTFFVLILAWLVAFAGAYVGTRGMRRTEGV